MRPTEPASFDGEAAAEAQAEFYATARAAFKANADAAEAAPAAASAAAAAAAAVPATGSGASSRVSRSKKAAAAAAEAAAAAAAAAAPAPLPLPVRPPLPPLPANTSLPMECHGGVFVRWEEDRVQMMKALIAPAHDTPYGGGLFEFDITIPAAYPAEPPAVLLVTTGGGTFRFNPNLYQCGKVCLSLLGTWQGEPWDPQSSTLMQVLMSIYALIFVEQPYFNEPCFEVEEGTERGRRASRDYNGAVRSKTVELAMLGQYRTATGRAAGMGSGSKAAESAAKRKAGPWDEVVRRHFDIQLERITKVVTKWIEECDSDGTKPGKKPPLGSSAQSEESARARQQEKAAMQRDLGELRRLVLLDRSTRGW